MRKKSIKTNPEMTMMKESVKLKTAAADILHMLKTD